MVLSGPLHVLLSSGAVSLGARIEQAGCADARAVLQPGRCRDGYEFNNIANIGAVCLQNCQPGYSASTPLTCSAWYCDAADYESFPGRHYISARLDCGALLWSSAASAAVIDPNSSNMVKPAVLARVPPECSLSELCMSIPAGVCRTRSCPSGWGSDGADLCYQYCRSGYTEIGPWCYWSIFSGYWRSVQSRSYSKLR